MNYYVKQATFTTISRSMCIFIFLEGYSWTIRYPPNVLPFQWVSHNNNNNKLE